MSWLERRWYSNQPVPRWLLPLEKLYSCLANKNSAQAKSKQWQSPVPVIVVGNISVGGTGKTPLVVYLIELLRAKGYRPGIVSRGYKSAAPEYPFMITSAATPEQAGDEPYMLYKRCRCPIVIDADRCAAAKLLLEETDCDLIISDDGLQHYRLGRDVEIAVIDGKRGIGNGHLLPAGPLREGQARFDSVDFIVRNGTADESLLAGKSNLYQMDLTPQRLVNCQKRSVSLDVEGLAGSTVHALAGIGNPKRFFSVLQEQAKVTVLPHAMPDHYKYQPEDLQFGDDLAIVMTEKDAVKVQAFASDSSWYLEVSAQLPDNFSSQLLEKLQTVQKS